MFGVLLAVLGGVVSTVQPSNPVAATGATCEVRYVIESVQRATNHYGTGSFVFYPWVADGANPTITIRRGDGGVVAHQILWAATGDPAKVLFDCSSGDRTFVVTEGVASRAPRGDWKPSAGVILETRAFKDGPVRTWKEIRRTCEEAAPVLGRSLVPNIFLGVHPHGPTEDFVSIFRGVLQVDRPGKYTFAVVSDDASSFFLDGQHVVSWPGVHGIGGPGRHGKFQEDVDLKAGRHAVEFLNVEKGFEYTVVLAWKPPDKGQLTVIPPEAFAQPSEFRVARCESADGSNLVARFSWEVQRHQSSWGHYIVYMKLRALCDAAEYTWTMDDGTTLKGREVLHTFLSPGMRGVKLAVSNGHDSCSATHSILAHPLWKQIDETDQDYWGQIRKVLVTRDLTNATTADLVNILRMTSKVDDNATAKDIAGICMNRLSEWGAVAPDVAMELGRYYQSVEVRNYAAAQRAFDAAFRMAETNRQLRARAQLAMVVSMLPAGADLEAVQKVLADIDSSALSPEERRLKVISEGDLMFAMGKPDTARSMYIEAGTTGGGPTTPSTVKRAARIETARDYNRRGEHNAAERVISSMQYESPVERLSGEVALILLDAYLGRKDFTRAYVLSRRLLQNAESDSNRPALLYRLAESAFGVKARAEAGEAVRALLKEFPYSESAARARERWDIAGSEKKQ